MELNQIRAFIEVSRHRNLTRAAAHLHISASALSSQIKSLEEKLGLSLFVRSAKGMHLTDQGRELLGRAKSVLSAALDMQKHAEQISQNQREILKVGMNADPGFLKMSKLNNALSKALPDMAIRYISTVTLETAKMLHKRKIHIGFVFGTHIATDVTIDPITNVDFNVVIPKTMYNPQHPPDWDDIAGLPWVWGEERCPSHCKFQAKADKRHLRINKQSFTLDEEITKQLVKDSKGCALVRYDEAVDLEKSGQAYIWERGTVTVPLGVAYLSEQKNSTLTKSALSAILDVWR